VYERILRLISTLGEKAEHNFFIQTREIKNPIFDVIKSKNLKIFYDNDLSLRKKFGWPPETDIVRISKIGKEKEILEMKKFFEKAFQNELHTFHSKKRGSLIEGSIILKLSNQKDQKINAILKSLGPDFEVKRNPERLF
jgi:primosomal protein N'